MKPVQTKSRLDQFDGWDISENSAHHDFAMAPLAFLRARFFKQQASRVNSDAPGIAGAVAGAALGALAGGIVWLAFSLSVAADMGYLAVLVGILAGNGARLGAGSRVSMAPRFIALIGTLLGILACKYLLFAYEFVANIQGSTDYFNAQTWYAFRAEMPWWLGPFELFWGALAIIGAWFAATSDTGRKANFQTLG